MTTIKVLVDNIKAQVRDPFEMETTIDQVIQFINDAAFDAAGQGWVIPLEDDESVTFSAVSVSVPATFAWIQEIRYGTNYVSVIPRHYWDIRINGGVPVIFFDAGLTGVSGLIKFVGFKRPKSDYTVLTDTVDESCVAFLRARAIYNALQFIAVPGTQNEDAVRQAQSETRWRESETILRHYLAEVQEKKYVPKPRAVPGR